MSLWFSLPALLVGGLGIAKLAVKVSIDTPNVREAGLTVQLYTVGLAIALIVKWAYRLCDI